MKFKSNLICTLILFALFIALTACVLFADVGAVGPEGSKIGLSSINKATFDKLGQSEFWYAFTEYLGYFALALAAMFVGVTAGQFFKRKSLKKVDVSLLALMGCYGLMAFFYVLFEIVVINYRPVLEEGELAASYPSSHTFLVCTIILSALLQMEHITADKLWKNLATVGGFIIILLMVVGRLLSGVHWFTDILGGVLLSSAVVMLYHTVVCLLHGRSVTE